jgi:tetraacyldisaccharide 4'-kinase
MPGPEAAGVAGRRVLAFAGIARPAKFFASLQNAGATLVARLSFPDHHPFADREFRRILVQSRQLDALPVTTPKDAIRLTAAQRAAVHVVGVRLAWDDTSAIEGMLDQVTARRNASMNRSTSVSSL